VRGVSSPRADARRFFVAARVVVASRRVVAEDAPSLVERLHTLLVAAAVGVVPAREPLVAALNLGARLFAPRAQRRIMVSLARLAAHLAPTAPTTS
jgi:hypothetical protein